jgi:hypothetical protein
MTSKLFQAALSALILGTAALGAGSAQARHYQWFHNPLVKRDMRTNPDATNSTMPRVTINNGQPVFDSTGRLIINHNMPVPPQPPKPIVPMHF